MPDMETQDAGNAELIDEHETGASLEHSNDAESKDLKSVAGCSDVPLEGLGHASPESHSGFKGPEDLQSKSHFEIPE